MLALRQIDAQVQKREAGNRVLGSSVKRFQERSAFYGRIKFLNKGAAGVLYLDV